MKESEKLDARAEEMLTRHNEGLCEQDLAKMRKTIYEVGAAIIRTLGDKEVKEVKVTEEVTTTKPPAKPTKKKRFGSRK